MDLEKRKKLLKENWEFKKKRFRMRKQYYMYMHENLIEGFKIIILISALSVYAGCVLALVFHILT